MKQVPRTLLFWRHAQAVDAYGQMPDMARPLTKKGNAQAKVIAKWLLKQGLNEVTILSSPAVRAIQTVEKLDMPFSVRAELMPETGEQDVLRIIHNVPGNLLLVGHEPWMSEVIARLLRVSIEALSVKKGSLWYLQEQYDGSAQASYTLVCAQLPN